MMISFGREPSADHDFARIGADRQQATRSRAGPKHRSAYRIVTEIVFEIETAGLDRERHAKCCRQSHRARSFGPEEFGGEDVERKTPPDLAHHQHKAPADDRSVPLHDPGIAM